MSQHRSSIFSFPVPFKEEKLSGLVIADPPGYPSKATAPPFWLPFTDGMAGSSLVGETEMEP